jgi:hypothetical protein
VYVAPDGSYSASSPSARRRLAAGTVDWIACGVIYLVASIVGGIVQGAGSLVVDGGGAAVAPGVALIVLSQLIVAGPVVAYFAYYWREGSTLGMRAADIELVRESTGSPPGWRRTVPRGCLAFVLAIAALNAYLYYGGRQIVDLGAFAEVLATVSAAVAAIGLAEKAWLLADERRRSALDRLFGLVYVEELVLTNARRSPWAGDPR